jgi:CelD/BcsL family acetyltransferase involved in cellulose biosynthesis
MTLRVETIDDPARFAAMRTAWTDLLARSPDDSLTLTWEWLSTWWQVYGQERELRIVTVHDGATLVGAAPLLARRQPHIHHGVLPFKRFELLASGEGQGEAICSDYIGWIAAAGREADVAEAVLDHLIDRHRPEWEEIVLPDVAAEAATLRAIIDTCGQHGLHTEIHSREPSPYIRLPGSFDAFLETLGSSLRYQLRRGRREVDKVGGRYRVVTSGAEIPSAFSVLVELHQARWIGKGHAGAFASARRRDFHERILPLALQRGWLRLGLLELDSGPIGAIYNFRYNGRVYFYQSGIAPQPSSHLRPGVLLHGYEIEAAIAAGDTEYDFLKRGDSDYKDQWTNTSRDLVCLRISQPLLKQHALRAARWTYHTLLAMRRRLTSNSNEPTSTHAADG